MPLPEDEEARADLLETLAAFYRRQSGARLPEALHRDLKPDNVTYRTPNRESARVETVQSPNATPAEAPKVRITPADLSALADAVAWPSLRDRVLEVAQAVTLEPVSAETALACVRWSLSRWLEGAIEDPVRFGRSLAQGKLQPAERAKALLMAEPPARQASLSMGDRFRHDSLVSRARALREVGKVDKAEALEADAARLRSGAA